MARFHFALILVSFGLLVGCGKSSDTGMRPDAQAIMMSAAEAPALAEFDSDSGLERAPDREFNTEAYDRIYENPFLLTISNPLSTFSIDVDTASYANARRFLNQGQLPPPDAVRIEEFLNYFTYEYEPPRDERPFSAHVDLAPCPWKTDHTLARIGLMGRVMEEEKRPAANLVFLLDVSGSMQTPNKLPLLKSAMRMLVQNLSDRDRVAIVVYAGASGVVLPPTSCETKEPILLALDQLQAGGTTAGSEGILLAYEVAQQYFSSEAANRVILCTDGDFNVGITNQGDLIRLIEEKARGGVFLSVLGFGMGNLKDSTLEKLADKGNGNYAYIDTILEAQKVLVEQMGGTLVTIAKDVKIQVDFNPRHVGAYRLIGYENRLLRAEDFRDDAKDAGEIGAGHTVTALYELVPPDRVADIPGAEPSKYQQPGEPTKAAESNELLTVRLRYKEPQGDTSQEVAFPVTASPAPVLAASPDLTAVDSPTGVYATAPDMKFAAAVAAFGMLLRDSSHKGAATYEMVLELAQAGKGADPNGYRGEFIQLVKTAQALDGRKLESRL